MQTATSLQIVIKNNNNNNTKLKFAKVLKLQQIKFIYWNVALAQKEVLVIGPAGRLQAAPV